MIEETITFSSHESEIQQVKDTIEKEFPHANIGDIRFNNTGNKRGNIVIPLQMESEDPISSNVTVPVELDQPVSITKIVEHVRTFYESIIKPFSNLTLDLAGEKPQWKKTT